VANIEGTALEKDMLRILVNPCCSHSPSLVDALSFREAPEDSPDAVRARLGVGLQSGRSGERGAAFRTPLPESDAAVFSIPIGVACGGAFPEGTEGW
jgi:hypothetical protein